MKAVNDMGNGKSQNKENRKVTNGQRNIRHNIDEKDNVPIKSPEFKNYLLSAEKKSICKQ